MNPRGIADSCEMPAMLDQAAVLIAALGAGTLVGTFTGLVPGVHVNTVAPVALGLVLTGDKALAAPAALFIVSVAVVHTIINVIPTLAAPLPEDDTALSLLPIQRLAQAGHAGATLVASVRASWLGGLAAVGLLVALFTFLPGTLSELPRRIALQLIIGVVLLLVLRHSKPGRCLATFGLAGTAGITLLDATFVGPLGGSGTVLLPAFAGLFGAPLLLLTLHAGDAPDGFDPGTSDDVSDGEADGRPDENAAAPALPALERPSVFAAWTGAACGLLVALVPGLTSATAGAVGRAVRRPRDDLEDVTMLSAVDTSNVVGNTGALLVWGATRSGASVAAEQAWPAASGSGAGVAAGLVLGAMVVALASGSMVALRIGPGLVARLRRVDPQSLALGALVLLAAIVALYGGLMGLILTACLIPLGLLPHRWGTPRALLMGFLILPYLVRALPAAY